MTATINELLQSIAAGAQVLALEQSVRQVSVSLITPVPLGRTQQRCLTNGLRHLTTSVRWTTSTMIQIALPITIPPDAALALCVPILRQRWSTLWWPLASMRHLVLAGDTERAVTAMLQALTTLAEHQPMSFALHDPEGELQMLALPGLTATPDALATARLRALRAAWGAHQEQLIHPEPPLILVVVAPDMLAWRDLAPLLQEPTQAVHTLVLLSTSDGISEARDACHQVPVIEIGGLGITLPESHRPPGLAGPRTGEALVWRPDRRVWRGTPIKPAE